MPPSPIFDYFGSEEPIDDMILSHKQTEDTFCWAVIDFIRNKNAAGIYEMPRYWQKVVFSGRFIWDEKTSLLFYAEEGGEEDADEPKKHLKRVVPASMRQSLIASVHDTGSRHTAGDGMHRILRRQFWWPKMRAELRDVCKSCEGCQMQKGSTWKQGKLKLFPATRPFEMVSIDIVGPLPVTKTKNRYIITMIDRFSRYCMLQPTKTVTAHDVVQAMERWMSIFGPPDMILSDNGSQFVSKVFAEYNKANRTKQKWTTPYNPSTNGMIERLHRWIKERLSLISYDNGADFVEPKDDWSAYLPVIQHIYNTQPNRMLDYAPSEIIFGRNFIMPLVKKSEDWLEKHRALGPKAPLEAIEWVERRRAIIHNRALVNQQHYDAERKRYFDRNRVKVTLKRGDLILYDQDSELIGNERKLQPRWLGPYVVTRVEDLNVTYCDIEDKNAEKEWTSNVRKVKLFNPAVRSMMIAKEGMSDDTHNTGSQTTMEIDVDDHEEDEHARDEGGEHVPENALCFVLNMERRRLMADRANGVLVGAALRDVKSALDGIASLRI